MLILRLLSLSVFCPFFCSLPIFETHWASSWCFGHTVELLDAPKPVAFASIYEFASLDITRCGRRTLGCQLRSSNDFAIIRKIKFGHQIES